MLISPDVILEYLKNTGIVIRGVLHIGAHEGEEKEFYNKYLNITDDCILWVDGNPKKVEQMISYGFQNIYTSVLDECERDIEFNITNNTQASSILTLNHEAGYYTDINIIEKIKCRTETLNTFIKRIGKDIKSHNFWNLDIQGSELHVLRGSKELLEQCDVIYMEVNEAEVYKGCGVIDEIDELLGIYGFKRIHTLMTTLHWGDALYIKN